jgi:hypothetical protein
LGVIEYKGVPNSVAQLLVTFKLLDKIKQNKIKICKFVYFCLLHAHKQQQQVNKRIGLSELGFSQPAKTERSRSHEGQRAAKKQSKRKGQEFPFLTSFGSFSATHALQKRIIALLNIVILPASCHEGAKVGENKGVCGITTPNNK